VGSSEAGLDRLLPRLVVASRESDDDVVVVECRLDAREVAQELPVTYPAGGI